MQEEKFGISKRPCIMLYLLYKHQWITKPWGNFNSCFALKAAIYYVAIATVTFSHVKLSARLFKRS